MKKIIVVFLNFFTGIIFSQSILMSMNGEDIYTSVFEKNYKKDLELLGTDHAIDNFIDFNLLKQYALKNNIEDSQEYEREFANEAIALKDSLFYPNEVLEPILQDYYKKIQIEKKIQLLFFKNKYYKNRNEKNKDKFIKSIIHRIDNDPSRFEEAVLKYSQTLEYKKPSYVDIFSLNKSLVDAIYKALLNTVTFYEDENSCFLILVSNDRKYLGEIIFDQIYIPNTVKNAKIEIIKAYNDLKFGGNFNIVKQKFNQNFNNEINIYDDETTYQYIYSQIKLNTSNEKYSQPIKLTNGYAIFKYYYRESYDTYSLARKKLLKRLINSIEIDHLNDLLVNRLKTYSFYRENSDSLNHLILSLPKSYNKFKNYDFSDNLILIRIGESKILTANEVLTQLKLKLNNKNYDYRNSILDDYINYWVKENILEFYNENFFNAEIAGEELENLKKQLLIKNAFNLIALQARNDLIGQKKFLKEEAAKLTWDERIEGTYYYCINSEIEDKVLQWLKNKKTVEFIKNQFKDNREDLIIDEGKSTRNSLNIPSNEILSKGIYRVNSKNRKLIIDIKKIIKKDIMTLEDLRKNHINEYIDYKTTQILKKLKEEAIITINPEEVQKLKKIYN